MKKAESSNSPTESAVAVATALATGVAHPENDSCSRQALCSIPGSNAQIAGALNQRLRELGRGATIARATIGHWRAGRRKPTPELADALERLWPAVTAAGWQEARAVPAAEGSEVASTHDGPPPGTLLAAFLAARKHRAEAERAERWPLALRLASAETKLLGDLGHQRGEIPDSARERIFTSRQFLEVRRATLRCLAPYPGALAAAQAVYEHFSDPRTALLEGPESPIEPDHPWFCRAAIRELLERITAWRADAVAKGRAGMLARVVELERRARVLERKLLNDLSAGEESVLTESPEFSEFNREISKALVPFPDAAQAVANVIGSMNERDRALLATEFGNG